MGRTPHSIGGYESKRDIAVARTALETVEAAHLETRLYPTLSGGERQRVQLARVLAQVWEAPIHGNRYLLLDEPTNSLDLAHQHSILHIARSFAHDGAAVLVVLHDLNLAAQYADEIILLKQGCVLAKGQPAATLTPGLIQTAFGMPVMVIPHPCLTCPLIVPTIAQSVIHN
jgi:iron complex transport system ATP-binding protein